MAAARLRAPLPSRGRSHRRERLTRWRAPVDRGLPQCVGPDRQAS